MTRFALPFALSLLVCLAPPAAALDPAARGPTLDALDALEAGKYADAVAAFSRAIDADPETPVLWVGRGVARVLTQDPAAIAAAEKDLLRARKLDPQDQHARLWLAFAYNANGDLDKSAGTFPAATRDSYENFVSDVGRNYGLLTFAQRGRRNDAANAEYAPSLDYQRQQRAAAVAKFPDLAAAFSSRVKGTLGDLGPLLGDRARKLMADRQWAAALATLDKALQTAPNDVALQHDRATCHLNLGAAAAAREQFTRVLLAGPDAAASFAGRAIAAAALGDAARAASDLDHAARLDPARAAEFKRAVDDAVRANPPVAVPLDQLAKQVEDLAAAARGQASDGDLLARAIAIIKATNAHRLRSDETYFDRRLRLELAAQAKPDAPDALSDLGEFLYREATVRHVEKVEPRAEPTPYRVQDTAPELKYAEQTCDRALAAKPDHVKALTYKAMCLMARLQWADAETILKKALAVDPTYGPLLEGMTKLLNHAAAVRAYKADALRQTETWEDSRYFYWRHPSPAELAQADALDRQAQRLWELAEKHLTAAAQQYAGKPLGQFYAGVLAKQQNRPADARAAFERCVQLDPAFQSAWDELAILYAAAKMPLEAAEAKSRSVNLVHTTAGHMLRYAWVNIQRTKFKTARDALTRAMAYDPAEPRVAAYLAVTYAADDRPGGAVPWFRAAAALDEARSVLNGTSLRSAGASPVPPATAAFTLTLNNRLGTLALAANRPDVAADAFARNVALEKRVHRGTWFTPLPASMLPDPEPEELGHVPEADAPISLFMEARYGLGQALLKQGKQPEALAQFQTVLEMPSFRHPTQPPISQCNDPWTRAKLALMRHHAQQKDWAKANRLLHHPGPPGRIPKDLETDLRQLGEQIQRNHANTRRNGDGDDDDATRPPPITPPIAPPPSDDPPPRRPRVRR